MLMTALGTQLQAAQTLPKTQKITAPLNQIASEMKTEFDLPPLASDEKYLVPHIKENSGFLEYMKQACPTLSRIPTWIKSFKHAEDTLQTREENKPRFLKGMTSEEVLKPIADGLKGQTWLGYGIVILANVLGWTAGGVLGWGVGAAIGGIFELEARTIGGYGGDYVSAFGALAFGLFFSCSSNSSEESKPDTTLPIAIPTSLATTTTYFIMRSFETLPLFFQGCVWALLAGLGTAVGATLTYPILKQLYNNGREVITFNREKGVLRKLKKTFYKTVEGGSHVWDYFTEDPKRIAQYIDGPFKQNLNAEKDRLTSKRDELKKWAARIKAAKTKKVLFKESTPEAQRIRILQKFDRTLKQINQAIKDLENEGIKPIAAILEKIPQLVVNIEEWQEDTTDLDELVELERLTTLGSQSVDEAQILLGLTKKRIRGMALKLSNMIKEADTSYRVTLEVEQTVAIGDGSG